MTHEQDFDSYTIKEEYGKGRYNYKEESKANVTWWALSEMGERGRGQEEEGMGDQEARYGWRWFNYLPSLMGGS